MHWEGRSSADFDGGPGTFTPSAGLRRTVAIDQTNLPGSVGQPDNDVACRRLLLDPALDA